MAKKKKIVRLADVGELEADLKKDLSEEEAKGKAADILFCESIEDELSDLENLPTIDPENLRPVWRDPETDPPKVETEVLVLYRNDIDGYGITTAHYEDGSVLLQDSVWYWEDLPDWGTYDEERDDYKIPKGWWEYRHFNPDEVYNNQIDRPVVGWMPLPEKLKKEGVA